VTVWVLGSAHGHGPDRIAQVLGRNPFPGADQRVPGPFPHIRQVHGVDPVGHVAHAAQILPLHPGRASTRLDLARFVDRTDRQAPPPPGRTRSSRHHPASGNSLLLDQGSRRHPPHGQVRSSNARPIGVTRTLYEVAAIWRPGPRRSRQVGPAAWPAAPDRAEGTAPARTVTVPCTKRTPRCVAMPLPWGLAYRHWGA
jgi:hypothetical protein